jgi:ferredoxin
MFCGLCTEVCPTACIINTNDFEMSDYSRESLIYDIKKLTLTQEESGYYFAKKEVPLPKPKPAKPAPKPAATAGDAAKPAAADAAKPASATATLEKPAQKAPDAKPEAKPEKTAAEETKAPEQKTEGTEGKENG